MSAEQQFLDMLRADAGVTDIVSQRIAFAALPEGANPPYVLFSSAHEPQQTLEGPAEDQVTFSVECWAKEPGDALELADAVSEAIDAFDQASTTVSVTVLSSQAVYEPDLRLNGQQIIVEWWP